MNTGQDHYSIKIFPLVDGRERRLYCRLLKVRESYAAAYRLYEDYQGKQWVEISVGGRSDLEELNGETFEQRVAADLLALGVYKYSG